MEKNKKVVFIIPVRHHENSKDWNKTIKNLGCTVSSIKNQTSEDWELIIVANENSEIPNYGEGTNIIRVNFPPNDLHDFDQSNNKSEWYEAVRREY